MLGGGGQWIPRVINQIYSCKYVRKCEQPHAHAYECWQVSQEQSINIVRAHRVFKFIYCSIKCNSFEFNPNQKV